jgi:hypothetical protein
MKFETKLKLVGGQFASFYQTICRSVDYYQQLANSGNDLQRTADDIMYWRILLNIKQRLEEKGIKVQGQLVSHINFRLSDIETVCLTKAILPPGNNSYTSALIGAIRDQVYKSTHRHVFNYHPSPTLLAAPAKSNTKPVGEIISAEDMLHMLSNANDLSIHYSISSKIVLDGLAPAPYVYNHLQEALEDGNRVEPIQVQIEDIGVFTIKESLLNTCNP